MVPFAVSSTTIGPAPWDFSTGCWACASGSAAAGIARANRMRRDLSRFDKLTYLRDANLRADVDEHALRAQRIHRAADVLPPGHQIEVNDRPPAARRRGVERVLGLLGAARPHPSQPVRDAVNVRVDADVVGARVRDAHPQVGAVATDTLQR